jgi:hypothetical protein
MMVADGKTSSGNDISKLAPHTYNISLGAATALDYGSHVVQISSTSPGPRYLLVRGLFTKITPHDSLNRLTTLFWTSHPLHQRRRQWCNPRKPPRFPLLPVQISRHQPIPPPRPPARVLRPNLPSLPSRRSVALRRQLDHHCNRQSHLPLQTRQCPQLWQAIIRLQHSRKVLKGLLKRGMFSLSALVMIH